MKKVFTRLLIIFALFTICGCSMNSKNKITYKEDYGYEKRDNITYKFIGESEHFAFETGKVYYGDNDERYIYLDNFKVLKKVKNEKDLDEYKIDLRFNDNSMFSDEMAKVKGFSKVTVHHCYQVFNTIFRCRTERFRDDRECITDTVL